MKRDLELCRSILRHVEADDGSQKKKSSVWESLDAEGYDENVVRYHALLLAEAGLLLIWGMGATTKQPASDYYTTVSKPHEYPHEFSPHLNLGRLTWAGHEFLEASRDETAWETAKATVVEKTGGLSFEILTQSLIQIAKNTLGLV